ncbi:hypothetical protein LEMLEM_LOCUS4524 [Lemmus lemmus]
MSGHTRGRSPIRVCSVARASSTHIT